ncbi:MAG TPA: protein kinase, partial [Gemmataceae bacterium]|nr:protein kinase [Gemmataceae bacterium]
MSVSPVNNVLGACPSREELKAFHEGELPEPALNRVAEHIEAPCPQCVAILGDLEDRAGPLLADLRQPLPLSSTEAEEACWCVLDHVPAPGVPGVRTLPGDNPAEVVPRQFGNYDLMFECVLEEQPPDRPTTDRSTAEYVAAGEEAPPNLPDHETLSRIDEGGMGVVWRVFDLQFRRPLAIKVMKAARSEVRFFAEARITAKLTHPSIVPVHAMGQLADGRPYYTMKLIDGKKLGEQLKAESDVASRRTEFLQVFTRVCQALAFAHSKGVIHRDLKPGNIMVGEHGEVQLMDWGLAKFLSGRGLLPAETTQTSGTPDTSDHHTLEGEWLGTWPYMPPEQANGQIEKMDRRSDVFGLGAILCEILTGKPPYDDPAKEDVMHKALEADLAGAYARLERCGADAELIALARACLSAEPNDRPADASAVEERLTGYLASVQERLRQAELDRTAAEAQAKEAVLTQQQAEKARRRTLWGAASAALFLVALLAAGFFAWRDREARQKHLADTLDRALTAAMSGDLEGAEQATAEAERAGASPGQVHMLRGQIALHRGESREARQHLEEAVRLLPKSVAARGMLAAAYASDGHWERYDRMIREMEQLTPSTPEDFLFKGYAEANLEPKRGLQTIKQAFDRRPIGSIALLLRAEVRAFVAQDTDDLKEAEGAVQDANYARELLRDNPAALWVSLNAHLAKAGVHEHRAELQQREVELKQRDAELQLAGKYADALKPFTELPTLLPEAVVYRWLYFREERREEEVLEELHRASDQTDHVYVTFCYALTLYRRGQRGDLEEALRVLQRRHVQRGTYNDRLLPVVRAEHDYPNKHRWPARALKASEDFAASVQDG